MDGTTESWLEEIRSQLRGVADAFWGEVREHGFLPLLEPVPPFNRPGFLSPAVAVGGLLAMMLFSGMAITALGSFLVALLALYLLLVQVFGVSIELHPFGVR
jgi:hypothetical protein